MSSVLSLSKMVHYIAVCLYVFHTMFTNVTPASGLYVCYSYFFFLNIIVIYLLHYFYLCVLFMYLLHHITCVLYITMYLSIYILKVGD